MTFIGTRCLHGLWTGRYPQKGPARVLGAKCPICSLTPEGSSLPEDHPASRIQNMRCRLPPVPLPRGMLTPLIVRYVTAAPFLSAWWIAKACAAPSASVSSILVRLCLANRLARVKKPGGAWHYFKP